MSPELRAFIERADAASWRGLPALTPRELGAEPPWLSSRGELGTPPREVRGVALPRGCFAGGFTAWIDDDDRVLVIEGTRPRVGNGERVPPPALGEPALRLPTTLGSLVLDGGELVHPDRGVAVRVNPENGFLLGLVGFAPTTADDYVRRLRPVAAPTRPLPVGSTR
jgi:hypothetical protein